MIISHHGHLEFGSPKTPVFPEAMLLHYLDDLDSKMECMRHLIERDREFAGNFTSFSPSLERGLLKKDRYLAGPLPEPSSAPAAPPAKPLPAAVPAAASAPASAPAPRNNSLFGDKLRQAWQPAEAKREG
jgi:3'-5' exoribonuclease